jgi:hypothetical protein
MYCRHRLVYIFLDDNLCFYILKVYSILSHIRGGVSHISPSLCAPLAVYSSVSSLFEMTPSRRVQKHMDSKYKVVQETFSSVEALDFLSKILLFLFLHD